MAKIAVATNLYRDACGKKSSPEYRQLATGEGWSVSHVVCHAGPHDQPFEEQHGEVTIAIVLRGTFQYRTLTGRALMTPGSVLLGNADEDFMCGHEHGVGDHCVSFSFNKEFCERLADGAGIAEARFKVPRLAPMRTLSPIVARASELLTRGDDESFEDLGVRLFAQAVEIDRDHPRRVSHAEPSSLARVTRVVRMIDNEMPYGDDVPCDLTALARIARLSPFHFLRVFQEITGITPHQYILRSRLRRAAIRLRTESTKILDIALACGFRDVSNFNRTFRAEFGMSPRRYRSRIGV